MVGRREGTSQNISETISNKPEVKPPMRNNLHSITGDVKEIGSIVTRSRKRKTSFGNANIRYSFYSGQRANIISLTVSAEMLSPAIYKIIVIGLNLNQHRYD